MMRANTRRQLREWRWVAWFLMIGWWYLPTLFVAWVLWELFKLVVLTVSWIIVELKEVK